MNAWLAGLISELITLLMFMMVISAFVSMFGEEKVSTFVGFGLMFITAELCLMFRKLIEMLSNWLN